MSNKPIILSKSDATHTIMTAKSKSNITFAEIADKIGKNKVWLTSAILGEHPFNESDARTVLQLIGISETNDSIEFQSLLDVMKQIPKIRGDNDSYRFDPTISRLYEILRIYGPTFKTLINEMSGRDGIMSAIDCNINCDIYKDKTSNDRIIITIDGKFLEYKAN